MTLFAVAAVSAGVLAYEVLLMRLLAIVQWHHFAYMVISIALLGYGVSGTLLSLTQDYLKRHFTIAFAISAALFGITAPLSFALAQRVPFNALEIVWNPRQFFYLLVLYLLFTVPFVCGANCVALAFATFGERIGRIYRYDLTGAGLGAVGIIAALFLLSPPDCLRLVCALGFVAAGLIYLDGPRRSPRPRATALLSLSVVVPLLIPADWIALRLSEFKGLSTALQVPGTEVLGEYSSPLGLLTVVRSPTIPFRHVPGLSLRNTEEPPDQIGVFSDGDSLSVINRYDGRVDRLKYLDQTTAALPYRLVSRPSVLILGAGGGSDVLQALYHGAARIDAVELNPQMVDLVAEKHREFAGGIYSHADVEVHVAEARGFVGRSQERWDVVQIPLLESFGAAAAGVQGLSESYTYTVEAIQEYLGHLTPDGMLSITRWLKLPPRDSLKLFATALTALRAEGMAEPNWHLALIRGWNTTTLVIKKTPFTAAQLGKVRDFAAERSFDIAYLPAMSAQEANRFTILDQPAFFQGTQALAGPSAPQFLAQYKFDIAPATDNRPYFFDFFKWQALPELFELRARGGAGLLDWGYLILCATLVQAVALSLALILLPLWVWKGAPARQSGRLRIFLYFLCLGFAFLFVEIAFIQRFIVFLSHPLYAISVVLCTFLVFAGLGSGYAPRLARVLREVRPFLRLGATLSAIDLAVLGIAAISFIYLAILPSLFEHLIGWPGMAKIFLSIALIAPLAFFMGMPFPLGLSRVSRQAPKLVPWAWGVNGCASVIAAVMAALLAIHIGFASVVVLAVLVYVGAAAAFRRPLIGAGTDPGTNPAE